MTELARSKYRHFDSASDAFDFCREANEPVKATFEHDGWQEYSLLYPSGHAKIMERIRLTPEPKQGVTSFSHGGEGIDKPDRD